MRQRGGTSRFGTSHHCQQDNKTKGKVKAIFLLTERPHNFIDFPVYCSMIYLFY